MPVRIFPSAALCFAFALVGAPGGAWAQAPDLRGGGDFGGPVPGTPVAPSVFSAGTVRGTAPDADAQLPPLLAPTSPPDPLSPNYGRPRPRRGKLYRPNPKQSPPLAPLMPYPRAPGTLLRGGAAPPNAVDPSQPAPTVAAIPAPLHARRPAVEADPFAPLGVNVGSLRLLPFVETSAGYETNPNQSTVGRSSPALRADGGLDLRSDFSAHSLTASLRGGYTDYPRNTAASRPDVSGVVDGRVDVTRNDTIDLEGRFGLATQTPGSPLLAVPGSVFITNRPTIVTGGATLGGTHVFNRLALGLRATFDRTQYGDATQSDGSQFQFSLDDYNDYGLVARAAYELTPALIPFAEIGADTRVRDVTLDAGGYARSSKGVTGRLGATFEFNRLLTGTASGGYAERRYEDPRLPNLRGPTFDASLIYTFSALTTVTLRANTFLSETTLVGASGAISRSVSVELAHALFRNFIVGGVGTFQVNQYQGITASEIFTQGTVKAAYSVTRDIQITASASRQHLDSSFPGSSYTDYIFLAGIRLQR